MEPTPKRLSEYFPPVHRILPLPALALASVVAKDSSSVYASSDTLYRGAVFGRDSLEVADDLLPVSSLYLQPVKRNLVRNILVNMGVNQGTTFDPLSEQEEGKIIHERRTWVVDGKPIRGAQAKIFQDLSRKWGGNEHEMNYYGSVDATPHFLRTLKAYCNIHGDGLLDMSITRRNGDVATMREVARDASDWVVRKIATSSSGLVEYQKQNPLGISNQVWKDSEEFYVHENKEMANHASPIASIEVQGLAYDGLMAAADFIPERAEEFRGLANRLRDKTIELLWQEDRQYFALGTDYDEVGKLRIINTSTANPGALLDTGFFDTLQPEDRQKYVSGIMKHLMTKDFLTNAGIRSRSLSADKLVPFWDYHGSFVTWPKETYDIAKGFRRQGFPKLAIQLENRLLNLVFKTREYPEFVYVDEFGRVLTRLQAGAHNRKKHGKLPVVEGHNKPERVQAWTASALVAIVALRGAGRRTVKGNIQQNAEWHEELEAQLLRHIPKVKLHLNPITRSLQYPTHKYHLRGKPRDSV